MASSLVIKLASRARKIERILLAQNQFSGSMEVLEDEYHGRTTQAKMTWRYANSFKLLNRSSTASSKTSNSTVTILAKTNGTKERLETNKQFWGTDI